MIGYDAHVPELAQVLRDGGLREFQAALDVRDVPLSPFQQSLDYAQPRGMPQGAQKTGMTGDGIGDLQVLVTSICISVYHDTVLNATPTVTGQLVPKRHRVAHRR
jgi:hypothetical protein